MVIRELISLVNQQLSDAGIDNSLFEAHLIVRNVTGLDATGLVLSHSKDASPYEEEALRLTERRKTHEPLQYILGSQEFMSLEFFAKENVLIPRSDTETLVELVIENAKDAKTLLDIGTGTGCIPLSIAHYCKNIRVRGLDINPDAVALSKKNAENLGLTKRSDFELFDILTDIPLGKYDIVTSNPPYIESDVIPTLDKDVRDFEPHLALDGGSDGLLFYRRICEIAPDFLNKCGMLFFEIGYNQAEMVSSLMEKDFDNIKVVKDLAGNNRVVYGTLK